MLLFDSRGSHYAFHDDHEEWQTIQQDYLEFCAITFASDRKTQLSWSSGKLVVLVAPGQNTGADIRMYVVDPDSGDVHKVF